MEPIIIGGVKVYVNQTSEGKTNLEVLPKEGNLNVIKYNDIIIKYSDQQLMKVGSELMSPTINYNGDKLEIGFMKGVEINGTKNDDRVVAKGLINSVFNFRGGGNDVIEFENYGNANYMEGKLFPKMDIDSGDKLLYKRFDYSDDKTEIISETNVEYEGTDTPIEGCSNITPIFIGGTRKTD